MACSCRLKCMTIVGFFCGLFAVILIPCMNAIIKASIKKDVVLKPGSYVYSTWTSPPFPIYFEYYIFNVINPQEVMLRGEKPVLSERGPYTYRLISTNENVTFNKNGTVSYRSPAFYVFDRSRSVGSETDNITTVNVILAIAVYTMKTKFNTVPGLMDLFFDLVGDEKLFVDLSVKDLIWGYEEPLLKAMKELLSIFKIKYDDHFGFFYKLNGTDDGIYTISTGVNNINDNFNIQVWKGMRKLDYWTTDVCNEINGTDGNIFHPFMTESTIPRFFFSKLCRSMFLEFSEKATLKGIPVLRYSLPVNIFQSASTNPMNKGFCTPAGHCLPDGLYNASVCYKGSPFTVSQPHFMFADKSVQDSVRGLHPDVGQHQSYVEVLSDVGAVLYNQKSFQFNLVINKTKSISSMSKIKDVHFPVFWFKETSTVTDQWASHIRWTYVIPIIISYCAITVFALAAVVMIGYVCFVSYRNRQKKNSSNEGETERLLNGSSKSSNQLYTDKT